MDLHRKLKGYIQYGFLSSKIRLNKVLGLPAQTSQEICLFKTIFDFMRKSQKFINIFEWGSGYSTIYYSKYLKRKNADFCWYSIDNNAKWHSNIKNLVKQKDLENKTKCYLEEFSPFWEKPGWGTIPPPCGKFAPQSEEEIAYTEFPIKLAIRFNVIIIDARFRKRCLQTAMHVLADDGIVIMHDAQKMHYHEGIEKFPYRSFFTTGAWYPFQEPRNKMWVGSFGNQKQIMIWRQAIQNGKKCSEY